MADLDTLRKRRHTWGHVILSAFVLSWLSVSFQPCLMAMELAPEMAMESVHDGHAGHADHAQDSSVEDCVHCDSAMNHDDGACDGALMSQCESSPEFNFDARYSKLIQKSVDASTIASNFELLTTVFPARPQYQCPVAVPLPSQGPALNLQFCVFLI